jgi:hypothetical protein
MSAAVALMPHKKAGLRPVVITVTTTDNPADLAKQTAGLLTDFYTLISDKVPWTFRPLVAQGLAYDEMLL